MNNLNIKRILLAGLAVDFISFFIFPLFFSNPLFGWVFKLEPINIWKWTPQISLTSMPTDWLMFLFSVNTVLAIFIAFLYAVLFKAIPGTGIKKGLIFGLLMYPMSVLVPMFSWYVMMRVAGQAVFLLHIRTVD
jgi:hypothetical protein